MRPLPKTRRPAARAGRRGRGPNPHRRLRQDLPRVTIRPPFAETFEKALSEQQHDALDGAPAEVDGGGGYGHPEVPGDFVGSSGIRVGPGFDGGAAGGAGAVGAYRGRVPEALTRLAPGHGHSLPPSAAETAPLEPSKCSDRPAIASRPPKMRVFPVRVVTWGSLGRRFLPSGLPPSFFSDAGQAARRCAAPR